MEELRNLLQYYEMFNENLDLLAVSLSARKNLCIHPEVSQNRFGKVVDGHCLNLTASFVRAKRLSDPSTPCCDYFEVNNVIKILTMFNNFFLENKLCRNSKPKVGNSFYRAEFTI